MGKWCFGAQQITSKTIGDVQFFNWGSINIMLELTKCFKEKIAPRAKEHNKVPMTWFFSEEINL